MFTIPVGILENFMLPVASDSPDQFRGTWMGEHDQDRVFEGTEELQTLAASESRYVKILT